MMVSDWVKICRAVLNMPIGPLAFSTFVLVAVAVIAYRLTSRIREPLVLAGVFALSFLLATVTVEKSSEPVAVGLFLAVLIGAGWTSYERLDS